MTLDDMLLRRLAEWRPDSARTTVTTGPADDGWSVTLTAEANDQLACRAWELSVSRSQPVEDLKGWAERLGGRATGLLEALRLLEVDPEQGVAQLRSGSPTQRGEEVLYYEVLLRRSGSAELRRYRAARDGSKKREQVAFALTHEALGKLVNDLAVTA
jgi:hypothetical protein